MKTDNSLKTVSRKGAAELQPQASEMQYLVAPPANRKPGSLLAMLALLILALSMSLPLSADPATAVDQVFAAERSFAKTMADRNLEAFAEHLSEEAIFFAGTRPLRGKKQIVEEWSGYFSDPTPPFSWEPDQVEVLDSGTLALSTGPVRDPAGIVVARFTTIWRLEDSRIWRVVFDKDSPASPGLP